MSTATPPTDWSRFEWKRSADDPALYTRELAAGEVFEAVLHRFCDGEQVLFVAIDIVLAHPAAPAAFYTCLRQAWLAVRFDTPTIAAQTVDIDRMMYRTAADAQDAQAWATRTVRVVEDTNDLDELQFTLSTRPIPEDNGDQTLLYCIARSETDYALAMHSSHVPFDGSGAKIVFARLLTKLAAYLADSALAESELGGLAWGTEAGNLAPAFNFFVGPRDPLEGELVDETLDDIVARLARSAQCTRGLKQRQVGPGPTRRVGYEFSEEDSARIFAACRQAGFTVNQIMQAALTLTTWLDNPPTSPTTHQLYSNLGLVNGRSRFAPQWRKTGKEGYVGYCLGINPTQIPVDAVTAAMAHGENYALLQTARIMRAEYARGDAYIGLLTVNPRFVRVVLDGPKQAPSTAPWYAGDGAEKYLAPDYRDAAGAVALEVRRFIVALNQRNPGPGFRTWTWRGRLNLSVDFNVNAMPREDMEGMVGQWARIIQLVVEGES